MSPPDPLALVAAIRDGEPDTMDRDGLAELVAAIAALRAWCDARQVRAVRAQRRLAAEGRAESPKDLLASDGKQSAKDAKAADERERVCTSMPGFEDALAAGTVSAGHLDALANASRRLDDAERAELATHAADLLVDAANQPVDAFERECRDLVRLITATSAHSSDGDELERQRRASKVSRWTDPETGMRHTHLELDPERDAALWASIDAARRRLRRAGSGSPDWNQLQVDAVLHAVRGNAPGGGGVLALVDVHTLVGGLHERSVCELADGTALPVATVRRLACELGIIPVVLDGAGRALDVGRRQRLATEAQRHALLAMHTTCAFPGCTAPVEWCEVHHVEPWEQGGSTDLDNLLPLCLVEGHHHLVHDGGWSIELRPDRSITVRRPDGVAWFEGSTIDRAPSGVAVGAS
jgi:hypothetical protein